MIGKKHNETTLNDLANMVASGFESVDKRFDAVDKRFDEVDKKMATKDELYVVEHGLNKRLDKVEYKIDELHEILARFEEGDILDLQNRIKILERTVKAMAKHM